MPGPYNILALDLATNIGFAKLIGGEVSHGSYRLPKTGEDVGRFLCAYEDWLRFLMTGPHFDYVVYEAPWVGPNTHQATARKLLCLAGDTEKSVTRLQEQGVCIQCREVNNASVRKHFIGKGNGKREELKRMTIDRCIAQGWLPKDDDDADALAVLDYACHILKQPLAKSTGPLFKVTA
jgi:Holliday junction resolvasome RuvABC endonuclease subunit